MMNDLKYACRKLAKAPGFTAVAVVTLALCLAANLVIFAVVDSVLLRPLPFREPDRLVTTNNSYPKAGAPRSGSSLPNYYHRRVRENGRHPRRHGDRRRGGFAGTSANRTRVGGFFCRAWRRAGQRALFY